MESILADVRFSVRSLLKRPGFTTLAVVTLALGIGVTTVAFNAVNALLLRPFRIPDADRIGWIQLPGPGNPRGYGTSGDFDALGRHAKTFERIEAEARVPISLRTPEGAYQAWTLMVSPTYLDTFDVPITHGRPFGPADLSGSEIPAVISHRFWRERLGAPESLAGRTIDIGGRIASVVGVVDDSFQGPGGLFAPDIWLPLARMELLQVERHEKADHWLTLFGRLAPEVTYAQADAELTGIARETSEPIRPGQERRGRFFPMKDGHPDLREIGPVAWPAFGAVNIVLLIACFNLSSLLIARSAERRSEIAVRTALGATRRRIVQQCLVESLLLALVAGMAALVVAAWGEPLLATFSLPAPIPQRMHLTVNWVVMIYTALVTLAAGIGPSLLPALRATREGQVRSIRSSSGFSVRSRVRTAFVVVQIAGATAFVVAAALFVRSFVSATGEDLGFDTDHLAVLQISPADHAHTPETGADLVRRIEDRVRAVPGVTQLALADRVPFYVGATRSIEYAVDAADCRAADCPAAGTYDVGPGYFSAMGIPLIEGRDIEVHDLASRSNVVINTHLAGRLWPGERATGRILRLGDAGEVVQVVGVAADMRHRSPTEAPAAYVFRPISPAVTGRSVALIARTDGEPSQLLAPIRQALRSVDDNLPPAVLATMRERVKMPLWPARTAAGFFTICGGLALALATIGLFGVMYYTVAQRTREFGIRIAIGATRRRVVRGVLGEGLRLAVPGIAGGLALGFVAGRVLGRMLHGVSAADPVSLAGTAALQLAVVLAACALPAYRATQADPIEALRQE